MSPEDFAQWFRRYRNQCRWQAAKSGPPHEYTIRNWRPEFEADFVRAIEGVREFGHPEHFYEQTYIYFRLDGLKYWTMGSPVSETVVLNRCPEGDHFGSH
jgi:hypothetical protein